LFRELEGFKDIIDCGEKKIKKLTKKANKIDDSQPLPASKVTSGFPSPLLQFNTIGSPTSVLPFSSSQ
jgi:hypothetical protein